MTRSKEPRSVSQWFEEFGSDASLIYIYSYKDSFNFKLSFVRVRRPATKASHNLSLPSNVLNFESFSRRRPVGRGRAGLVFEFPSISSKEISPYVSTDFYSGTHQQLVPLMLIELLSINGNVE
jgi:hypothetical protein